MASATGEAEEPPPRGTFDRRIKLVSHGARITPGVCPLSRDPAMRVLPGRGGFGRRSAASGNPVGRCETEWLTARDSLAALADLSGAWTDQLHGRTPPDGLILDPGSPEGPTLGQQEGAASNGHFGCSCNDPLLLADQFGGLERCLLQPGNAAPTAQGRRTVLAPLVARYRGMGIDLSFHAEAASAKPAPSDLVEHDGLRGAIRLPAHRAPMAPIGHPLTRPVGRPPKQSRVCVVSFATPAQSWPKPRRVMAEVAWYRGKPYPRVGFLVADLERPAEHIVRFYTASDRSRSRPPRTSPPSGARWPCRTRWPGGR